MYAKEGPIFTFSLPGGGSSRCPPSVTPLLTGRTGQKLNISSAGDQRAVNATRKIT